VFDNLKVLNLISISNLFEKYKEVVKRFVGSCTKVADFFWKLTESLSKNSKTTTFMRRTEVYERYFLTKDSISNLFISFQISNLFEKYKEVVKRFVGSCTKVADFFWKLTESLSKKFKNYHLHEEDGSLREVLFDKR
jgi:uncharacterized protein YaaR (DUF327 family)